MISKIIVPCGHGCGEMVEAFSDHPKRVCFDCQAERKRLAALRFKKKVDKSNSL